MIFNVNSIVTIFSKIITNLGGVGHCYAWQVLVFYFIHFIYIHILDTLCDILYFSTIYFIVH